MYASSSKHLKRTQHNSVNVFEYKFEILKRSRAPFSVPVNVLACKD